MTQTHEDVLEYWNERAAIVQYCGGFHRDQAESIARAQASRYFGFDCFAIIQRERQRMAGLTKVRVV